MLQPDVNFTKSNRINLRASPVQNQLIRRAAEASQKSVSEFILESACEKAENILLDQRLFVLDEANWQKFQEALERPAVIKPGLKKLLEERSPWE